MVDTIIAMRYYIDIGVGRDSFWPWTGPLEALGMAEDLAIGNAQEVWQRFLARYRDLWLVRSSSFAPLAPVGEWVDLRCMSKVVQPSNIQRALESVGGDLYIAEVRGQEVRLVRKVAFAPEAMQSFAMRCAERAMRFCSDNRIVSALNTARAYAEGHADINEVRWAATMAERVSEEVVGQDRVTAVLADMVAELCHSMHGYAAVHAMRVASAGVDVLLEYYDYEGADADCAVVREYTLQNADLVALLGLLGPE